MGAKKNAEGSTATSPGDYVKALKDHLEALEKVRTVEKDARQRLQKEGLSVNDQTRWAEILHDATKAIDTLERHLPKALRDISAHLASAEEKTK